MYHSSYSIEVKFLCKYSSIIGCRMGNRNHKKSYNDLVRFVVMCTSLHTLHSVNVVYFGDSPRANVSVVYIRAECTSDD